MCQACAAEVEEAWKKLQQEKDVIAEVSMEATNLYSSTITWQLSKYSSILHYNTYGNSCYFFCFISLKHIVYYLFLQLQKKLRLVQAEGHAALEAEQDKTREFQTKHRTCVQEIDVMKVRMASEMERVESRLREMERQKDSLLEEKARMMKEMDTLKDK